MTTNKISTVKKPEHEEMQIESLISQAISNNTSVDTMEKLLAMRRELKAEYAKEQYDTAMSNFQATCPVIEKTKVVKTNQGQIAYKYAPLEDIITQVKSMISENGFSYSVDTKTDELNITAICTIKHIAGHSESSSFTVPLGNRTNIMSASQQVAAAITYAKRYAFCNVLGILTGDEDTDAKKEEEENFQKVKVEEVIIKLQECSNLDELKACFLSLGNLMKDHSVVAAKDLRKQELTVKEVFN